MEERTTPETFPQLMLESQICFPLYAASRRIVNRYTPYLKPLGLTYTQYIVFLALWEYGEMTVGDLCRKLYLDNGTVTPLVKKMEAEGYIVRRRRAEDERVVMLTLTEEGWAMRDKVREIPRMVGKCVQLDPGEAELLYRTLYRILGEGEA